MKEYYTLTGAADWPMFAFMFSVLVALIGVMWIDLRGKFKEKSDDCRDCRSAIWAAIDRRKEPREVS